MSATSSNRPGSISHDIPGRSAAASRVPSRPRSWVASSSLRKTPAVILVGGALSTTSRVTGTGCSPGTAITVWVWPMSPTPEPPSAVPRTRTPTA